MLDKIMLKQAQAVTPENRIRSFRESSLDMVGIAEKINLLKEMVLSSNSNSGVFSFVSSIQTVSIWGIVIIIISGFVFLSLYMRALRNETVNRVSLSENSRPQPLPDAQTKLHYRHREKPLYFSHKILKIASIALFTSSIGSLVGSVVIRASRATSIARTPTAITTLTTKYPQIVSLQIPEAGSVPIRTSPSIVSPEVFSIKESQKIIIFRKLDGWAQVGLSEKDQDKGWWTNDQYLASTIK